MFYEKADRPPSLKYDPFKAIVAPRPIGWITTLDAEGRVNLAPYSFFNAVALYPPVVMFSSFGSKDSSSNIKVNGEFVCSLATWDLRHQMDITSAPLPPGVDEAAHAGLEMAPSVMVKPPRVAASPTALECVAVKVETVTARGGVDAGVVVVFGEVVGTYIDDRFIRDGRFDLAAARPIARCGYRDYAVVGEVFEIEHPDGRPSHGLPLATVA